MKDKFEKAIRRSIYQPLFNCDGIPRAAEECNTLLQQALKDERERIAKYYDSIEAKGEMIYPSEVAYYLRHLLKEENIKL